jgi:hypothetical protein
MRRRGDPFQPTTPPIFGKWGVVHHININKLKNRKNGFRI